MWVECVLTAQNKMAIWTRGMCKAYEVTKCMLMLYHTPSQHRQPVSLQSELYCICHGFILL